MSVFQFISSLVGSLAWPIVIVLCVLMLRVPIVKVILSLQKLSYKDLQLDFGGQIAKLQEIADREEVVEAIPKELQDGALHQSDEEMDERVTNSIKFYAETEPKIAISIAWSQVAQAIQSVMRRLSIGEDISMGVTIPHYPVLKSIGLLEFNNYIDSETAWILKSMNDLRRRLFIEPIDNNLVVEYDDVMSYALLAKRMLKKLATLQKQQVSSK